MIGIMLYILQNMQQIPRGISMTMQHTLILSTGQPMASKQLAYSRGQVSNQLCEGHTVLRIRQVSKIGCYQFVCRENPDSWHIEEVLK